MSWLNAVIAYLAANKDAALACGAILGPVASIIAAAVSYRAVVTGPRIQERIAAAQRDQTSRQLDLMRWQMIASTIGAAEQKWIDEFQTTLAELLGYANEIQAQRDIELQFKASGQKFDCNELSELFSKASHLVTRIKVSLGESSAEASTLITKLRELYWGDYDPQYAKHETEALDLASSILTKRRTRILGLLQEPDPASGPSS